MPWNQFFTASAVLTLSFLAQPAWALEQADFDTVAFKWDTGETVADGPIGIIATPAPVFDAAVNFQALDRAVDLVLTDGPNGSGSMAFGWMDSALWVPSNGDGIDLISDNPAHRVYATVSNGGVVQVWSAGPFSAGVLVGSTTVTLDPQATWRLSVLLEIGFVQLWLDDQLLIEGLAFPPGGANPALLGDDYAISVLSGPMETGEATLNDLARDAQLSVERYARILPHRPTTPVIIAPRTADMMLRDETAELGIFIRSSGSSVASGVTATLVPPPGLGLSVLSGPLPVPEVQPGESTFLNFTIQSSASTPVGSHAFELQLTGGVTQSIDVAVPLWDVDVTITDLPGGVANGTAETVFNDWTFDLVAPEQFDVDGLPSWFDIQVLDFDVTHAAPFAGQFWEEVVVEQIIIPRDAQPQALFLSGTVRSRDENNQPVTLPGSRVLLFPIPPGNVPRVTTANAQGQYEFINVPPGLYKIAVIPPEPFRNNSGFLVSKPFEVGDDSQTVNLQVPRPPPEADPRFIGPPAVAQGQTGTATKPPPPPPANPPPPKKGSGSGNSGARSFGVGVLVGVTLDLIDLGLAPKTGGATVASILACNLGGGAAGWLADPETEDVFYVGRSLTNPLDPFERTLSERVEMAAQIVTHQPVFDPPLVMSTSST
ncbi:MAG: carboxypeptidase-like regulatory domain-containing protein, partial [Pseudomonadota bacterium]